MFKVFSPNYSRRVMMLMSLLMFAVLAFAVPAKPGLTRLLTLSNGSTVMATLVGDEHGHYWQGTDGKNYQLISGTTTYQEVNSQEVIQRAQQRRAQANQRRVRRMAPHRVGDVGSITGKKKGLIILVNFTDVSFNASNNNALYKRIANEQNFSYGNFKGSMYDYFYAQSDGLFELTFDVVGPVTVSKAQSYYGGNDSDGHDQHPAAMVIEALKLVDSQVNFADYDWNNDKTVEQVYVVYAGQGEADRGADETIWPHEWTLSSANYYGDGSGTQTLDGVKIDTYACGGELNGDNNIAGIDTMCHEFSHCLGYPDFYDTDYSGGQGMGYWDLMDSGSYNDNGYQPAGYTSYERWVAGWKEPIELVNTQSITNMAALQMSGSNSYVIYNKANNNEYYLLENRQKTGWDSSLPGAGLLILHVDYNSTVWNNNAPNDDPSHQRMTWIPADNQYQYEMSNGSKYYTTAGMKDDPFPYGSVNAFGKNTTPAATLFNNNSDGTKYLDSSVENITQNADGTISFDFVGASDQVEPTPTPSGNALLYEGLSGYSGSEGSTELASNSSDLDYKSWSSITKVYPGGSGYANGGCLKFGSSKAAGSMKTGEISLTGSGTLTFYLKKYGSDTGKLDVTVTGATADKTQFTPDADWTLCTVNLTNATGAVTITLATSSKRAYVDEITLISGSGSGGGDTPDPVLAYYAPADGKKGSALKTAMCGIIYNRTEKSYDDLWTAFKTTDVRSDGKIWDMYSNITNYTPVTSGSSYSKEGDCYNREHSWPQSWFNSSAPMYTDLHHIYPTDGFVNGKRANYPFGEVANPTYSSNGDFSKLGTCTYPGYTGTVFEPANEYKGDFARTYFYMVTCYEEKLSDWYNGNADGIRATIDGSTYPAFQPWQLNMLMEWAKNDPVSEKEINRNNAVYAIQNNRNPFIDYPGLQEYIWGICINDVFDYDDYVEPVYSDVPDDPDEPVIDSNSYVKVTNAGSLKAGDKILIAYVNGSSAQVLSTTQDTKNRPATTDVTLNDNGTLTPGTAAQVITLEKDGENFLFNVGDGYLYAASSSNNYLKTETTADANAKAAVSISDGNASITFQGTNTRNTIRYNPNNETPIFSCYSGTSTGSAPQIYRQIPTVTLGNATDNSSTINTYKGEIVNVKLSDRTLYKDGSWNTLCLPFSLTAEQVTKQLAPGSLMTLQSSSFINGTLTLNFISATSIEAGKPYIIRWTGDSSLESPTFTGVTIENATANVNTDNVDFIGIYSPLNITAADNTKLYLSNDNTLYYPNAAMTIGAFRAYFQLKGITAGDLPQSAIVLNFDAEGTTGLNSLTPALSQGEGVYTLDGRKLNAMPTQKGVYIVNGKKVVIK